VRNHHAAGAAKGRLQWVELELGDGQGNGGLFSLWTGRNGGRAQNMVKTAKWTHRPSDAALGAAAAALSVDYSARPMDAGAYVGDGVRYMPFGMEGALYEWSADIHIGRGGAFYPGLATVRIGHEDARLTLDISEPRAEI